MSSVTVDTSQKIRRTRFIKGKERVDTYHPACCTCGHKWEIRADCVGKIQHCHNCSQRIKARRGGAATLKKYGLPFFLSLTRETRLEQTTCLERIVEDWLQNIGTSYEREYTFFTHDHWGCLIDFMVNGGALAVEVHGAYWHADPDAIERDARKAEALRYADIPLLVLSEEEVLNGLGYERLVSYLEHKGYSQ